MIDSKLHYEMLKLAQRTAMLQEEKARYVQELHAANGQSKRYGAAMVRLGKTLSTMGEALQNRYGNG